MSAQAAGVVVGCNGEIVGMDLFDAPETLKTLWGSLVDVYFANALRDSRPAQPTATDHARRFLERLTVAARPRVPALALGDELEIAGDGMVGAALLYSGRLCHLAAFSNHA